MTESNEIERLKAQLAAKDTQLREAARIGNILLERQDTLEAELEGEKQKRQSSDDAGELSALWTRHTELAKQNEKLLEANVSLHLRLEADDDDDDDDDAVAATDKARTPSAYRGRKWEGKGRRGRSSLPKLGLENEHEVMREELRCAQAATRALNEQLEQRSLEVGEPSV